MMKVGLIRPPSIGINVRGGGFYADRLYTNLQKITGLQTNYIDLTFNPRSYKSYDLVHFTYFDPFQLTLPALRLKKTIVEVHDLTPLKFPDNFPFGKKGKVVWPIQKFLLQGVDAVTTLSEASKKDIYELTNYPLEKIYVIYLAADAEYKPVTNKQLLQQIKIKYHLPDKFVLYVGGVNWNKNLPNLITACQKSNVNLVLVGREFVNENVDFTNVELQPFSEILPRIKNDSRILRVGFVPTSDLAGIYNLASVYVQPSVYEGFGLPVLEAMGCGTPVICGRNSSFPEIAGSAAIYCRVDDSGDLAEKISNTVNLPQKLKLKIGRVCVQQAEKFTWLKTAHKTYEAYQKVLGKI